MGDAAEKWNEQDSGDAVEMSAIRERLSNLEDLCFHKQAAADAFNEACKAAAEQAQIDPQVVKAYVTARCRDKMDVWRRRSGQMALLLEELE